MKLLLSVVVQFNKLCVLKHEHQNWNELLLLRIRLQILQNLILLKNGNFSKSCEIFLIQVREIKWPRKFVTIKFTKH